MKKIIIKEQPTYTPTPETGSSPGSGPSGTQTTTTSTTADATPAVAYTVVGVDKQVKYNKKSKQEIEELIIGSKIVGDDYIIKFDGTGWGDYVKVKDSEFKKLILPSAPPASAPQPKQLEIPQCLSKLLSATPVVATRNGNIITFIHKERGEFIIDINGGTWTNAGEETDGSWKCNGDDNLIFTANSAPNGQYVSIKDI